MNTNQNYVGRDSYANAGEKTELTIQERITQTEARIKKLEKELEEAEQGRLLMVKALSSLREWAEDTLAKGEKGRFLAASERKYVRHTLTKHIEELDHHLDSKVTSLENANFWINHYLERQAGLNVDMSWFELAPYPLPDHIQPNTDTNRERHFFRAFHDKMSPMIKENDGLSCVILRETEYYKTGGAIVVAYRNTTRKRGLRKYCFGRVLEFDSRSITLVFDHPDYKEDYIIIPLQLVLFVLKVESAQSPSTLVK